MQHNNAIVITYEQSQKFLSEFLKIGVNYLKSRGVKLDRAQKIEYKDLLNQVKNVSLDLDRQDAVFKDISKFLQSIEVKSYVAHISEIASVHYPRRDLKSFKEGIKVYLPESKFMKLFTKPPLIELDKPVLISVIGDKYKNWHTLTESYLGNKTQYESPLKDQPKLTDTTERFGGMNCAVDIRIREKRDKAVAVVRDPTGKNQKGVPKYRGEVALLCFDLDDKYSRDGLMQTLKDDYDHMNVKTVPRILVGCHLKESRYMLIDPDIAVRFAAEMHIPYMEVDVTTGNGLIELFKVATLIAASTGRPDLIPFDKREAILVGLPAEINREREAVAKMQKASGREYKLAALSGALEGKGLVKDVLRMISEQLSPQDAARLAQTNKTALNAAEQGAEKDNQQQGPRKTR